MTMEEQIPKPSSIKERIAEAARRGDLTMRPRWHFVLMGTLVGIGAILAFLALLYIASFIVFSLHQSGAWFAPTFGSGGWFSFFRAMPWLLIALSVAFAALLEVLVRRYSFVYRKSLVVTLIAILVVAVAGGILGAPIHRSVFRLARRGPPPPIVGPLYRDFDFQRLSDVHRGLIVRVVATSGSIPLAFGTFLVEDDRGTQWTVRVGPRTRLPFGAEFDLGDTVVIFGPAQGTMIEAVGMRELFDE